MNFEFSELHYTQSAQLLFSKKRILLIRVQLFIQLIELKLSIKIIAKTKRNLI